MMWNRLVGVLVIGVATAYGWGQSSSLYLQGPAEPVSQVEPAAPGQPPNRLSRHLAGVSLVAVPMPQPRRFAVHDLITIIVRESTQSDSESSLDTKKETKNTAEISNWPGIRGFDKLVDQVLKQGLNDKPKLGLKSSQEFKGDGDYSRKDTFVTRLTAQVIDIRPNGNLVLEARKFVASDDESMELILTGTCRPEDVAADNTVLSTQLFDLRLTKVHGGELRRATQKGLLTKFFETLFNF